MPSQGLLSLEEFAALANDGDDYRDELIAGSVFRRPPRTIEQGIVGSRIQMALHTALRDTDVEIVGYSGYLLRSSPDTIRASDISVVIDYASRLSTGSGYLVGAPQLAIEVVSPGDTAPELEARVRDFLGAGSARVWVAWPGRRSITVHRSDGTAVHHGPEDVLGDDALGIPGASLSLAVADCFPAARTE